MPTALHDFARRVLGEFTDEWTLSARGRTSMLRVTDSDGRSWYCKQTALPSHWRAEVRAYGRWFAELNGYVPELRAAERDTRMLIVSELPGETAVEPGPLTNRAEAARRDADEDRDAEGARADHRADGARSLAERGPVRPRGDRLHP